MYDKVKEYYGKRLQSSGDLQTNACCTDAGMPRYLKDALGKVNDDPRLVGIVDADQHVAALGQ